jgi:hypothetical protein
MKCSEYDSSSLCLFRTQNGGREGDLPDYHPAGPGSKPPSVNVIKLFFCVTASKGRVFVQGILKGGSIAIPLTSCLAGLESAV